MGSHRVFAFLSARALTQKQTLWSWFECRAALLQRLQRGVALESLGESGSSFGAESVVPKTASMGAGAGAEGCVNGR